MSQNNCECPCHHKGADWEDNADNLQGCCEYCSPKPDQEGSWEKEFDYKIAHYNHSDPKGWWYDDDSLNNEAIKQFIREELERAREEERKEMLGRFHIILNNQNFHYFPLDENTAFIKHTEVIDAIDPLQQAIFPTKSLENTGKEKIT